MARGHVLKCRFCDYHVSRWRGRKVRGVRKLQLHVQDCHEEAYLQIRQHLLRETADFNDADGLADLAYVEKRMAKE